jgi:hypothetical protein
MLSSGESEPMIFKIDLYTFKNGLGKTVKSSESIPLELHVLDERT